jgi:beta-mannosidase
MMRGCVLSVELTDAAGEHLSSAWYPFNHQPKDAALRELEREPLESLMDRAIDELLAPYADLRSPLRDLPRTRLEARLDGAELVVRNIGGVAAPLVLIDGFPHGLGRVLGDNAFGLAAGAERRIAIETGGGALDGLTVRAWNADAVPVS